MKAKSGVAEDPIVAEVRQIRADLWREGGGTVAGLLRLLQTPPRRKRPAPTRKPRRSGPHPHSGNDSTP